VSIESRPKTVVRAGGVARIDSSREIPFLQVKTLAPDGTFTTTTEYKRIGIELVVSPRVIGSSTLALEVHLEGSQQVGTLATLAVGSGQIEVPVIAYRTAKTLVYLEPGQTLVIGGLTQEREQEIVSKVPILGDIPLLGFFFRSTFTSVERQHVLFAISPRIIQRSDFDTDL
jgi:type II secretory pathway component GspD/PulD (secretin)